jgi:hypothetical protein
MAPEQIIIQKNIWIEEKLFSTWTQIHQYVERD